MQRKNIIAIIALVAALALVPASLRAAEPYEINVITSLTGRAALLGKQTADALHLLEARVNQEGGIGGRPIKFVIFDDQTNPQDAVSLANAIMAKNVPVILGPYMTANCNAVFPLVQSGPVMWCYSPSFRPPKDSYGFSVNASSDAQFRNTVRYFHNLGLNRVAIIIAAGDAAGQDAERSLDAAVAVPEVRGMKVVVREYFNLGDLSVTAQMVHIKSAGAQAVFAWVTGTPFGTILRGYSEAGLDAPVVTTNGNADFAFLKSYANFIPKTLLIPAMLNQAPDQVPAGRVKRTIDQYYAAFKSTLGVSPTASSAAAWDSGSIIVDALKKFGTDATARQIRDYVDNLHGWIGVNGEYDFRDGSQRGVGDRNVLMIRWDPANNVFVAASKPGGAPLR